MKIIGYIPGRSKAIDRFVSARAQVNKMNLTENLTDEDRYLNKVIKVQEQLYDQDCTISNKKMFFD